MAFAYANQVGKKKAATGVATVPSNGMAQGSRAEHYPRVLEPQPGAELHHARSAHRIGDLPEIRR